MGLGMLSFGTIKAPGCGAKELSLCDCKRCKALPGDQPSDSTAVIFKKAPQGRGLVYFANCQNASVPSFLKHRFQIPKLLFMTCPCMVTIVHHQNGLLNPQTLLCPGCFRGASPSREEHLQGTVVQPPMSVLISTQVILIVFWKSLLRPLF